MAYRSNFVPGLLTEVVWLATPSDCVHVVASYPDIWPGCEAMLMYYSNPWFYTLYVGS